jgi:toxin CptA
MTSAPAIGFEYRPSRLFGQLLLIVALLALLAVALSGLSLWLKLVLAGVVAMAAGRARAGFARSPVAAAGWSARDGWTLHLVSHEDIPATLASFRVLGSSVLLRLQTVNHGQLLVLLVADNSDADIRRRLRMRLATLQSDEALPRL